MNKDVIYDLKNRTPNRVDHTDLDQRGKTITKFLIWLVWASALGIIASKHEQIIDIGGDVVSYVGNFSKSVGRDL